MISLFSKSKNQKVSDISFLGVLLKRFVIVLLLTLPIVIVSCVLFRNNTAKYQSHLIDEKMSDVSLELIQLEDMELASDKSALLANVWLSNVQDEWRNNKYIKDSSISFYNLSEKQLIAKSFEIPIILSDEVLDWWQKEADVEIGTPKISLSNEMISFCETYKNKPIYIEKMVYMNEVLCPEKIIVLDKKGVEEFSCSAVVPSVPENRIYNNRVELKLIGNYAGESIYTTMADFTFFEIEHLNENAVELEEEKNDIKDETSNNEKNNSKKEFSVKYNNPFDEENTVIKSKSFSINGLDYQLDYAYELNFFSGAWAYLILINGLWIFLCAMLAFITTKDSYNIFR